MLLNPKIKYIFENKKKGDGKILFMDQETYESLEGKDEGLCYKKFKPNIVFAEKISFGEKIKIGDTIFETEKYNKKCYEDCMIKNKKSCLILKGHYGFLRALNFGKIYSDDETEIL